MKRPFSVLAALLGTVVVVLVTPACGVPPPANQPAPPATAMPTTVTIAEPASLPSPVYSPTAVEAPTAAAATPALAAKATPTWAERTHLPAIVSQATFTPTRTPTRTRTPTPTRTPTRTPTGLPADDRYYDMGTPTLQDIWVDPVHGDDGQSGASRQQALRTVNAAWDHIPLSSALSTGYRINLLAGVYPCEPAEPDDCQNRFANRTGTYQYPIIVRAYDGAGTVTIRGGFEFDSVAYLYLLDLRLAGGTPLPTNLSGNNLLHLVNSHHVLLRRLTLAGPDCATDACNNLQEVLKVNQAQYLYVEDSVIGGAWHSSVDYFSVQYGHFLNNRVHTAGQWGMYVKGGTAYLRVEGNEFDHSQLGFQAGQSSNLAVMRSPWLHYEAYDIKFVNNVLHDLPGVGLSVQGGYNILFAYNTLYRVGTSSDPGYALAQTVHGERGCTATDEMPNPVPSCVALIGQGGWGPNYLTDNQPAIPNRNVYVYNNLIYNPAPAQTLYTHLYIAGAIDLPTGFQHITSPVATDNNLVMAGNLIWNGPQDHPLGIDESSGCQPSNPTCNATLLASRNTINRTQPQLVNPAGGDFRPASGGNLFSATTYAIPNFGWSDAPTPPTVPSGNLSNSVTRDRNGVLRSATTPPGAYVH